MQSRSLIVGAAICCSTPVLACDCIHLDPSFPNFETDLDRIEQFYPIAAEGVVEADGDFAWRLVPTREYRGPGKPFYRIELHSDCSLDPIEMKKLIGKSVFLLLSPGAGQNREGYEAGRCVNLLGGAAEAAIRARFSGSCKPH